MENLQAWEAGCSLSRRASPPPRGGMSEWEMPCPGGIAPLCSRLLLPTTWGVLPKLPNTVSPAGPGQPGVPGAGEGGSGRRGLPPKPSGAAGHTMPAAAPSGRTGGTGRLPGTMASAGTGEKKRSLTRKDRGFSSRWPMTLAGPVPLWRAGGGLCPRRPRRGCLLAEPCRQPRCPAAPR